MLRPRWVLAFLLVLVPAVSLALAQTDAPFNEREVPRQSNIQDKDDIWVLDFKFKDPRLITVDIPGRGRRVVWYLWYQVTNNTKEPRTFIPDFELVTHDKPGIYHDQVLPKAQEAIRRIEDPTGYLDIKNSVTIAIQPIPVSKPDATPRPVTGVAMWDDVNPDSNRYSIFVSGLSNGWSMGEVPPDNKPVVRRKTLQLNFRRLGDRHLMDSRDIKFVAPVEWLYRSTTLKVPAAKPAKEEDKPAAIPVPVEKKPLGAE